MLDSLLLLLQSSWPERATSGLYALCCKRFYWICISSNNIPLVSHEPNKGSTLTALRRRCCCGNNTVCQPVNRTTAISKRIADVYPQYIWLIAKILRVAFAHERVGCLCRWSVGCQLPLAISSKTAVSTAVPVLFAYTTGILYIILYIYIYTKRNRIQLGLYTAVAYRCKIFCSTQVE